MTETPTLEDKKQYLHNIHFERLKAESFARTLRRVEVQLKKEIDGAS